MIIILYLSDLRCKYKKELTEEEKQNYKKKL
jgi:hypothetical protein